MSVNNQMEQEKGMLLTSVDSADVLVLGSGIAGISAALSASEVGKNVLLACKGKLFSGSSFYPGTWGLGLIGPADPADEVDLEATIQKVGCGMAAADLVKTFVSGIHPAIERVEKMGVRLRKAQAGAAQQEYIPCFDHKHRSWNGIEFDSAREIFGKKLQQGNVKILEGFEVLELAKEDGRVCGAVVANGSELRFISAKTVVLATGGYGSLFQHHLCTSDVEGMGQGLALDMGCSLINMEFMQIMPGYLKPAYGTIFNEKVFRYTTLESSGKKVLPNQSELFEIRSGHGPFTSRLASREIDLAIDAHPNGVIVHYDPILRKDPPEFVKTYFDWLKKSKGLTIDDSVRIALFAHAANGGVAINTEGATGVPGLFAAGEVTGGMHGADRIGGLSTANGLVFGTKAGINAAMDAEKVSNIPKEWLFNMYKIADRDVLFSKLQSIMTKNSMAVRSEDGLTRALNDILEMRMNLSKCPTTSVCEAAAARRLNGQLKTANAIVRAQLLRKESRGSHYRADYPCENAEMAYQIRIDQKDGEIRAEFVK